MATNPGFHTYDALYSENRTGTDDLYLAKPDLSAHWFWQVVPHIIAFLSVLSALSFFYNWHSSYLFPILFLSPLVVLIFVKWSERSRFFDQLHKPAILISVSWGFWICLIFAFFLRAFTEGFVPPFNDASKQLPVSRPVAEQVYLILFALIFTSFGEELVRYYVCRTVLKEYFPFSPKFSHINTIVLYCTAVGLGFGIAKGALALYFVGKHGQLANKFDSRALLDSKYSMLFTCDYVLFPLVKSGTNSGYELILMQTLILVPLHGLFGTMWGVSFVRFAVLKQSIAFGHMLMVPWIAHAVLNLLTAEIFFVHNDHFGQISIIVSIAVPLVALILGCLIVRLSVKRRIEPFVPNLPDLPSILVEMGNK